MSTRSFESTINDLPDFNGTQKKTKRIRGLKQRSFRGTFEPLYASTFYFKALLKPIRTA